MFITVKSIFAGNVLNEDILDDITGIRTAFCIAESDAEYSIPVRFVNLHKAIVCICRGYHMSITLLCLSPVTSREAGKGYNDFLNLHFLLEYTICSHLRISAL